jgi:hypothetical protein
MKTLLFFLLILFNQGMDAEAAGEPDYKPAALSREIEKVTGSQQFQVETFPVPGFAAKGNVASGKYFRVTAPGSTLKYLYMGRVNSCRAGGCGNGQAVSNDGIFEFFDYFILFDSAGSIVAVRVYNYQATHGQEIMVKGWLKQFIGFSGSRALRVGKEVDSITGATISVYAITDDISEKTALLKNHLTELPRTAN